MNLLPLIDVLVMLIFFAFVTMQFRSFSTLNITMPNIESAGKEGLKDPLEIGIDIAGVFSVGGAVVTEEDLIAHVRSVAAQSKDVPVVIKVDQDAPVRLVTRVMDICRGEQLNKIRLQSRGR
jgi:biopolymer transport protein ExbD